MISRQKCLVTKRNLKIGDVAIIQEEAPPPNEWPLGNVIEVTSDQQGLVRADKIKVGVRNLDKEGNDHKVSIVERPIQKVVFLVDDGMD